MKSKSTQKRVVVIGGGTGSYTVLMGLKKHPVDLSAVVSMADEGGSTGLLRDELGVLPPGDVRQCLIALSTSDLFMRELMNYRFENGSLQGHSFGNIFLSALEKTTGSFDRAVERASEILRLKGTVIPVTLTKTRLFAVQKDGDLAEGETAIQTANLANLKKIYLRPAAKANPKAIRAIKQADAIIIGPGDFYSSLVPNLLVGGIANAIQKSKAKKIYVCNLMTKKGHTSGWTVKDYSSRIERYLQGEVDYVVYNMYRPSKDLISKYARAGEVFVEFKKEDMPKEKFIGRNLVSKNFYTPKKGDTIKRSLIRHDSHKLAKSIVSLL